MQQHYVAPQAHKNSFTCPHCGAFAQHQYTQIDFEFERVSRNDEGDLFFKKRTCAACDNYSFFINEKLVYPESTSVPKPHPDTPDEIKQDYQEAALIETRSPRAAAALLRLAIQKLCAHLGEEGQNIHRDIGSLVEKGLPVQVQQSLDIVRVVGNNAVHPGRLNLDDTPEIVSALFGLINFIVDDRIAKPKRIQELYDSLPQGARDGIEQRDS